MKKLNLECLGSLQLTKEVIDRFSVSVTGTTISSKALNYVKKVLVYDVHKDELAFTFESEGNDNDISLEVKQNIVKYLACEYSKQGYHGVLVNVTVFYADNSYHTEPNTIFFIKDTYVNSGICKVFYDASGKFCVMTSSSILHVCREDFFDIGILE